jgi:hypothetical protein
VALNNIIMTDFYKKKSGAIKLIDKMLEERKPIEEIEYIVLREYGFGKAMINKRILLYRKLRELQAKKEQEAQAQAEVKE